MKRTHNEAKDLFIAGDIDAAWEVAKQDEGMHEGITKDQWVAFMTGCVANG